MQAKFISEEISIILQFFQDVCNVLLLNIEFSTIKASPCKIQVDNTSIVPHNDLAWGIDHPGITSLSSSAG